MPEGWEGKREGTEKEGGEEGEGDRKQAELK